jgi:hypothetical protein
MKISENSTQDSGFVLPLNGRVVIIDDNKDEAIPLMNVLSMHGIPFAYFDGKPENLPGKPIDNIRIIFLDIVLVDGMDDKSKVSTIINVLIRILGENNNPYIIIAWTKHDELIDEIKKGLSSKPLFTLTLEKRECKKEDSEEFDINIINEKLLEAIKKFGAFRFFLEWENIVHESAGRTVNEISSIITRDDNWNQNIIVILIMLAEAYAGQQADNNHDLNAMLAINNLLLDIIENRIQNTSNSASSINNQTVNLTFINRIKGELNRRLLIANEQNNSVIPGNVYKNEFSIKCDINNLCNNNNIPEELNKQENHIILEVSPYCDYAQKKWKFHRILPGFIWPEQYGNMIKKADYIYKTPVFLINNELCFFVFDLRYLSSIPFNSLNNKTSLYRFRKELVVDIQSKIAGHINRPGVTYAR